MAKFIIHIQLAFGRFRTHPTRTLLTVLGILIGVFAVVVLLAAGNGLSRFIAQQFTDLGTNLVFISPVNDRIGQLGEETATESTLRLSDALELQRSSSLPEALLVAPAVFRTVELAFGGQSHFTVVRAVTPDYSQALNLNVSRGTLFSEADYNRQARVAVLGPTVVETLYPPYLDPVGTEISINGLKFEVVGLLASKGASSFGGSRDDIILVPLTTAQERLFETRSQVDGRFLIDAIIIQVVDESVLERTIIEVTEELRRLHGLSVDMVDDFQILTQTDFLSAFAIVNDVLRLYLGALAGISLLVGGIGIMNVMLVSVTERTSEIGLRKAVGARNLDILGQFLTEALVLALVGGGCGLALGSLTIFGTRFLLPDLDIRISIQTIGIALGFSTMVGLFFGIYPAYQAAKMDPIEALRYE